MKVFYNSLIRSFTGLKKSNAVCSLFLISGVYPIECEIDCSILTLFGAICRMESTSSLKNIALRQLALPSHGWFYHAFETAKKYNMETLMFTNLYYPRTKNRWANLIKRQIRGTWWEQLTSEAKHMDSLTLLDLNLTAAWKPHHIWPEVGNKGLRCASVYRAILLTGTYITQSRLTKFYKEDPSCTLCCEGEETIPHMLMECASLNVARQEVLSDILEKVSNIGLQIPACSTDKTKLILHFGPSPMLNKSLPDTRKICNSISLLCLKLHNERTKLLENLKKKKKSKEA